MRTSPIIKSFPPISPPIGARNMGLIGRRRLAQFVVLSLGRNGYHCVKVAIQAIPSHVWDPIFSECVGSLFRLWAETEPMIY